MLTTLKDQFSEETFIDFFRNTYLYTIGWLNQHLFEFETIVITPLSIIRFFFILFVAIWISRLLVRVLMTVTYRHKAIQKSLIYRITRLFQYVIISVGFIIALSSLGFDLSSFVLVAGALGVGLGFGLQNIFNNFLSGIILLFESEIKVGDFIELESGARGEVREINFRSTNLKTNDGTDILVPNSQMINTRIVNWTLNDPFRRVHVPFTIEYGSDKELMVNVIIEAAKNMPLTVKKGKPDPTIFITKLGDNGIECELVIWVNERANTRNRYTMSDYLWMIETTLNEHHIAIPKPRREIYYASENQGKPFFDST